MNKTLSNRIRQVEQAAAFRQPQRSGGLAELYRRMYSEPESLSPELRQLIEELQP